ncbi:hypothetical protein BC829DRAFT_164682 [Chytridium lagenaria]|nr:hypothetical protein BC829DRAFT_164682 [Chytridium lagenaria]
MDEVDFPFAFAACSLPGRKHLKPGAFVQEDGFDGFAFKLAFNPLASTHNPNEEDTPLVSTFFVCDGHGESIQSTDGHAVTDSPAQKLVASLKCIVKDEIFSLFGRAQARWLEAQPTDAHFHDILTEELVELKTALQTQLSGTIDSSHCVDFVNRETLHPLARQWFDSRTWNNLRRASLVRQYRRFIDDGI